METFLPLLIHGPNANTSLPNPRGPLSLTRGGNITLESPMNLLYIAFRQSLIEMYAEA